MSSHVVALSGGKDSTAMALRLRELYPDRDFIFFCTPTGDELPDMQEHWKRLESLLGAKLTRVSNQSLDGWIEHFKALPNWRQRWCTRLLKIEPCLAFLKGLEDPVLYVGLRADEPSRQGIYSDSVETVLPMQQWGWGIGEVKRYLAEKGIKVPTRTDCARCYGQRLGEWYELWRQWPSLYRQAEAQEEKFGHTFRSAQRDSWPADLKSLRARFEEGRIPQSVNKTLPMFEDYEDDQQGACRVCRL